MILFPIEISEYSAGNFKPKIVVGKCLQLYQAIKFYQPILSYYYLRLQVMICKFIWLWPNSFAYVDGIVPEKCNSIAKTVVTSFLHLPINVLPTLNITGSFLKFRLQS